LHRQDFLKEVEDFINFILYNPKNFSGNEIRCPCAKCKNKKFYHKDLVMMHLLKKGYESTGYNIQFGLRKYQVFVVPRLYNINLD